LKLLQEYVKLGHDLNQYEEHFDNWITEGGKREYSILYVNYEFLWKNLNAIFEYCKIPTKDIIRFPRKRETKKNIPDEVQRGLTDMYASLQEKINCMGPVILLEGIDD